MADRPIPPNVINLLQRLHAEYSADLPNPRAVDIARRARDEAMSDPRAAHLLQPLALLADALAVYFSQVRTINRIALDLFGAVGTRRSSRRTA